MKQTVRHMGFMLVAVLVLGVAMMIPASSGAADSKTLQNLMAAYNGESNAHAKYLAYAQKADQEGYGKAASLFRAAAGAEEIHFKNHAKVIQSMGGMPKADIKLPAIKSTKENLEDAIKGETYEQVTMYPEFIAQAEKENNPDALRTFHYAKAVEAEHAKLYKKALDNLGQYKMKKADFYVCRTCGYTVEDKPGFAICPVCGKPTDIYKLVS